MMLAALAHAVSEALPARCACLQRQAQLVNINVKADKCQYAGVSAALALGMGRFYFCPSLNSFTASLRSSTFVCGSAASRMLLPAAER